MNNQQTALSLQHRAFKDLIKRSLGGILIYPFCWIAIGIAFSLQENSSFFFYLNLSIIFIFSVLRLLLVFFQKKIIIRKFNLFRGAYISLLALNGLHWGILTAYALYSVDGRELYWTMVVCATAIASLGVMTMTTSIVLVIAFPLSVTLPSLLTDIILTDVLPTVIVILLVSFIIFIINSSKVAHGDYWNAITNIETLKQRTGELELLSTTDKLTGLKNRHYFDHEFAKEWRRSHRHTSSLTALLIDIDNFKQINDTYGHLFGDQCLKDVSGGLLTVIRRGCDILARYGGEEFIVILSDTTAPSAECIANKILLAMRELSIYSEGNRVSITVSIGISSTIPKSASHCERLLELTDEALYSAKEQGKDCYKYKKWTDPS
jgi:diguanylate cyclase (GGDEF)-like protein